MAEHVKTPPKEKKKREDAPKEAEKKDKDAPIKNQKEYHEELIKSIKDSDSSLRIEVSKLSDDEIDE